MNFLKISVLATVFLAVNACKHKIPGPIGNTTTTGTNTTGVIITPTSTVNNKDSVCYAEEIAPILSSNCAMDGCHSAQNPNEGINLSSYAQVKKTISGKLLLQVIQDRGGNQMPPKPASPLSAAQILVIKNWVAQGMKENVDCLGPCDTSNVTYSGIVFPILQNACIGCHITQTPIFSSYAEIKPMMDNGKIPCTIQHGIGCSPMPKGTAALSPCKQKQIMKWLAAGSPNN